MLATFNMAFQAILLLNKGYALGINHSRIHSENKHYQDKGEKRISCIGNEPIVVSITTA